MDWLTHPITMPMWCFLLMVLGLLLGGGCVWIVVDTAHEVDLS